MGHPIKKILIANRGEIASRIIRSCRILGIKTVAIYSDVDDQALHVRSADESFPVGAPKPTESYLNQGKIIEIAKNTRVDAIHPGYGFLSENPDFAQRVHDADIIFVGPSADAMRIMGRKTSARKLACSLGIPTVPGSFDPIMDEDDAVPFARKMGYPILLKAAAGGGGKGMRLVHTPDQLRECFQRAKSEAASAFDDGSVYIEKYLKNPRHIEIQILADSHGNAVHLGERECSVQRRHQKIIEESPSTFIDTSLREQLVQATLTLIKAAGYTNAGTIEFILDEEKNFYFLEMNTRLQVEHPVTELRTGIDLVREQIRIAEGEPLRYAQRDISFHGHAIECRIYAEDAHNAFMPSTGAIVHLRVPEGEGMREDSGVEEGSSISTFYDPLLSKIVAWGKDRHEALSRMTNALEQYELFGVRNNIDLCLWVLKHRKFICGDYSTTFLDTEFHDGFLSNLPDDLIEVSSITAIFSDIMDKRTDYKFAVSALTNAWKKQMLGNME
jgi:acetyl-CoA carboxylase biotin carboxylase subunit